MDTQAHEPRFRFKQFGIDDSRCGMKIGTDGVLLGAWAGSGEVSRVLDAGAGSALIALMIAQRFPGAMIRAVELEPGAASDARLNVACSPWPDRIEVVEGDVTDGSVDGCEGYDLIVSNPPYFRRDVMPSDARRADARHATTLSYETLVRLAADILTDRGILAMVAPAAEEQSIIYNAELNRLKLRRLCRVVTVEGKAPSRILIELGRHDCGPSIEQLVLRHKDNTYSSAYRELTGEFYLNL